MRSKLKGQLMAEWLEQASRWHEMYCHDLEVMSSNLARVELGVRSTSVLSRTWAKTYFTSIHIGYWCYGWRNLSSAVWSSLSPFAAAFLSFTWWKNIRFGEMASWNFWKQSSMHASNVNMRQNVNSYSASHDNWCTGTLWNRVITAQCEGMGEVGSARYEPAPVPPCPSIRALCYSNCQRSTQSHQQSKG